MSLLPTTPSVEPGDREPSVIDLDADADRVFRVLRSETARAILTELYSGPTVASVLAERIGTSIQNVHYHIDNLLEADLVAVVDTRYSSKGREMKVYAPANEPLMLVIGGAEARTTCRRALPDVRREVTGD